ncbi:MAG: HlyD family efflux transporter periplasmic adaptor subunit [Caldimonas sp.]
MTVRQHDLPPELAVVQRDSWLGLSDARTAEELCGAWLNVLCESLASTNAGVVLLAQGDGSYAPVATAPLGLDLSYLADIATDALRQREGIVRHDDRGHACVAYPLQSGGRAGHEGAAALHGAVVLDLGMADEAALEYALRFTHWGAGWLLDLFNQRELTTQRQRSAQGGMLLDTLLALLGEHSLREAALALVNRLGREFGAQQVQLGLARRKSVRVLAMSHAAWFDERTDAVNLAAQAMHEAFDQRQRIDWPAPADDTRRVFEAHRRYAESQRIAALCSLPLVTGSKVTGVLMLERDRPFEAGELEFLDTLALALAPIIELEREAEQGVLSRAWRKTGRWLGLMTDSSYPAIKLAAAVVVVALLLLAFVPVPYRVSAQALVEGAVQRSAVAPFEGFLREAPARAGDLVKTGQVLAVLDDKDLKLERVRWESELEVAQRKEREAMAKANRVDQRLAAAQANQARAQLDLVLAKLERVQVVAPFDAVVVKGDLSQLIGSPLEQGKVLFELAPLDEWRVILKVDERDIGRVAIAARGELVLASLPGTSWPFTVKKLTPISVAEEGRNFFRVEAELGGQAPKLSPNMEGVAKVEAGERSLLWVWTHPLIDWARLTWWKLMP